mgnify:CR=1 FL=1
MTQSQFIQLLKKQPRLGQSNNSNNNPKGGNPSPLPDNTKAVRAAKQAIKDLGVAFEGAGKLLEKYLSDTGDFTAATVKLNNTFTFISLFCASVFFAIVGAIFYGGTSVSSSFAYNLLILYVTFLMLLTGRKLIKKAYLEAKKNDYRFLSYGDAMIII